jgi:hypothetical protein
MSMIDKTLGRYHITPASVLTTGHIPSLHDFTIYASEENEDSRLVCTPVSREHTRSITCEAIRKPSKGKKTRRLHYG